MVDLAIIEAWTALSGLGLVDQRSFTAVEIEEIETFFGSLKNELVHRNRFKTRDEARRAIFEYIEVWYNRRRRHSSL